MHQRLIKITLYNLCQWLYDILKPYAGVTPWLTKTATVVICSLWRGCYALGATKSASIGMICNSVTKFGDVRQVMVYVQGCTTPMQSSHDDCQKSPCNAVRCNCVIMSSRLMRQCRHLIKSDVISNVNMCHPVQRTPCTWQPHNVSSWDVQ